MSEKLCLAAFAIGLAACATAPPPPPPPKDEFVGFGALRGDRAEKKKAPADDEKPAEAAADDKGKSATEEKTPLTKEQVLGAIATAQKKVDGCYKKFHDAGIYVMQITIDPAGTCQVEPMRAPTRKEQPDLWADVPKGIDGGKSPKSPTNRCVASALQQVAFPKFDGKALVVTYPLVLK